MDAYKNLCAKKDTYTVCTLFGDVKGRVAELPSQEWLRFTFFAVIAKEDRFIMSCPDLSWAVCRAIPLLIRDQLRIVTACHAIPLLVRDSLRLRSVKRITYEQHLW